MALNNSLGMENQKPTNFSDGSQRDDFARRATFIIAILLLIVVTIASNLLVFLAVYAFRGLRTVTNCFVISLASADLSVAFLAIPAWLSNAFIPLDTNYKLLLLDLCTRWVDVFCAAVSIYSATLVSLDRYLAINKPLRYREMVTRSRANKAISSVWIMSLVISGISFIQYHSTTAIYVWAIFVFIAILCVPLLTMIFAYACIYSAAVEQLSKMKYNEHNVTSTDPLNRKRNAVSDRRKRFYKELCITKTLAITISMFIIAWAPYLIIAMVETFHPSKQAQIPEFFSHLIHYLPFINSFVNPWIYAGINKDFRKALKKLMCAPQQFCFCAQNENSTKRSRTNSASTGRTLIGSFQMEDQTGSFRGSNPPRVTPRHDVQCTSV
ncbi:octopamine receptor [Exaiptasia diaphana]|uniref:G-protein coupled receptors family 1 profile domain-containing protein n=1 Tax=Exaiptasia diaphana TaxID=2652724 RepID=A0A913XUK9_EXADI|nr:octopamine receptor [Exaiptasia diaphana]XP_020910048.1 octopamine receptor [Exaiptasia diaphana]XP_020910049.1 octopamine receptor [Exaiptasia diaphana]XP_028517619.1 octopamine receptor [Exaiptasia diaphana]KXJ24549.1 Beta-2 adrenergic receptor [Exaiptasia diaphana]